MSVERRETNRGTRWDVRLRAPDGRAYKRTFRTRKEADRFERAELASRDRGVWVDQRQATRTFADVAEEWLASNPAKRASARERDQSALRTHVAGPFGRRQVGSITPADVQRFVNDLATARSPRTVGRTYGVLRAVLHFAADRYYIGRSPCRGINLPKPAKAKVHVFSPDELVALADAMPAPYAPMVWIGALLGLRWGEVAALRVRSIDFLRRAVKIDEQRTRSKSEADEFGPPKSEAGERTLAAPEPLLRLLADHLGRQCLGASSPDALLFTAPEGGALDYTAWRRRVWCPAVARAGVGTLGRERVKGRHTRDKFQGPGFHDLRRTSTTALVVEGVDIRTAQGRLGHSDPRLTLAIYAQVVPEADRQAADRLAARFLPTGEAGAMDVPSTTASDEGQRPGNVVDLPLRGREGGIRTRDLSVPNAAR